MKAAIYARYSTNLQDKTSITGQVTNCEALAKENDWLIVEQYSDEAISGTDDSRPGYQQLLADSEAGKFDAIIVDETSRLTRRPGELPRLLEILSFRDQFLMDCKGFDSRQETASLLASIYGGILTRLNFVRSSSGLTGGFVNGIPQGFLPAGEPTDTQARRLIQAIPIRSGERLSMMTRLSGLYGFLSVTPRVWAENESPLN